MKFSLDYTSGLLKAVYSSSHKDLNVLRSFSRFFFDKTYLKIMLALYNQKFSTPYHLSKKINHYRDPVIQRLSELMKFNLVMPIGPNQEDYPVYLNFWRQLNSHSHSYPVFYALTESTRKLLDENSSLILQSLDFPALESMRRIGRQFEKFYETENEVQQAEQLRIEELELHTLATCVQCEKRILKADIEARQYGEFNKEIYCKDCFTENMLNNFFTENSKRLKKEGVKDPYQRTWKPKIK